MPGGGANLGVDATRVGAVFAAADTTRVAAGAEDCPANALVTAAAFTGFRKESPYPYP